jgi:hypothetical protein
MMHLTISEKTKIAIAAPIVFILSFLSCLSYLSGNASPYRIYGKDTGPLYAALATLPRLISTARL